MHGFVTHLKPRESELILRQIAVALKARRPQMLQDDRGVRIPSTSKNGEKFTLRWHDSGWVLQVRGGAPRDGVPAFRDVELESRNFC